LGIDRLRRSQTKGSELNDVVDLHEIYRRLAETVAWCGPRASLADPKDSLRTPMLRPANLSTVANQGGNHDYEWETFQQVQNTLSVLADQRVERLRLEGIYPDASALDLRGGRLLVAAPLESDWCCLSEEASEGFIDALDVPAWDTWICYVQEEATPDPEAVRRMQDAYRALYAHPSHQDFVDWQPPPSVSYLLCWVPPQFVSLTEVGITVNPVECFFWAADYRRHHYNTETLRQLDAAGLLI
jgi:hypothetical protein